ncbi:MAG: hypothetical protein JWP12_557 [Bacteroidetes bacterium]|nr:hypothetical protein [Bacteroidota bacterium]
MNFKKLVASVVVCSLFVNAANAQFNIGAQGTIGAFSGGVGFLKGGGIEAGYGLIKSRKHKDAGSKLFVCGSFNYYAGTGSGSFDSYALSSSYSVYSITVPYTWKLHLIQVNVGAKYYIAGGMAAPFSFYGQVGLTIEDMPVKYTIASYNRNNYDTSQEPQNENAVGVAFHAGVGIDVKAGPVHIYLATRLIIPANEVNGEEIEIVIPFAAVADLGVRIPIGGK